MCKVLRNCGNPLASWTKNEEPIGLSVFTLTALGPKDLMRRTGLVGSRTMGLGFQPPPIGRQHRRCHRAVY
jgi:hypothetical protein